MKRINAALWVADPKAADAEALALELLHLGNGSRTREHALIVGIFHRADQHDVMALQVGDDDIADGDDGRIASGERLNRHLPAAQKYQFDIQPVLAEDALVFGQPKLGLARADGWIADANFLHRLSAGAGQKKSTGG